MSTRVWAIATLALTAWSVSSGLAQLPDPRPAPTPSINSTAPLPVLPNRKITNFPNIVRSPQAYPPVARPNTVPPPGGIPITPSTLPNLQASVPTTPPNALVWDSEMKELVAEANTTNALIVFNFTNVHTGDVIIKMVRPSCGCTTMQLPPMPWTIPPGASEQITASLDLRGKSGVLTKSVTVDSSSGYKSLLFKVTVPMQLVTTAASGENLDPDRVANMKAATVDRQVVFKNAACAKCHAEPAVGKMGEDLYRAACAICHDTPHRATMVPDLLALKFPTSAPYWKYWIMNGRPGSLMPAFAKTQEGPLTDEQINSLVEYLTEKITKKATPTNLATPLQPASTVQPAQPGASPVPQRSLPKRVVVPPGTPVPATPPPPPANNGSSVKTSTINSGSEGTLPK